MQVGKWLGCAAAVVALAGCTTTPAARPVAKVVPIAVQHPSRRVLLNNRVFVEGDSVLLGTVDTLPAAMRGWHLTMDTVGSRRLPEAIPILRARRKHFGSVVVIQMGNNFIPGEDGSFKAQLNKTMRILRGVPIVVWVTVARIAPWRAGIDRVIEASTKHWPSIRVADWAPIAAAHRSYTYDGLHLTTPGRLAMARLIARTVGPAPS